MELHAHTHPHAHDGDSHHDGSHQDGSHHGDGHHGDGHHGAGHHGGAHHGAHQRGAHQHGAHAHEHPDDSGLADLLDLDAKVLGPFLEEVLGWLQGHVPHEPRRVADMGAGTGAGSLALARRFPAAEIIAIDRSSVMIDRVREAARAEGLGDRLRVAEADLDTAWPAIGALDVVWAASSLHHVADPGRVLRDIHAALNQGGLLAVVEMDALPRFLPDDFGLGRPGLEARCHEAAAQAGWNAHPDWGPHLEQAGFELAGQRSFSIEPSPSPTPADASARGLVAPGSGTPGSGTPGSGTPGSVPSAVARYAYAVLSGFRAALHDRLDTGDLGTLDRLLAEDTPDGLLNRRDLTLRGTRTVWAARRPNA